jgi:hypothetical protein
LLLSFGGVPKTLGGLGGLTLSQKLDSILEISETGVVRHYPLPFQLGAQVFRRKCM